MNNDLTPQALQNPINQATPVDFRSKVKSRWQKIKQNIKYENPKKLVLTAAGAILTISLLLIVLVLIRNRASAPGSEADISQSTPKPKDIYDQIDDEIKTLENDFGEFDIEDKTLAPPEINFDVRF